MQVSLVAVGVCGLAASAFGGVDSFFVAERFFNDFPDSNLTITADGPVNGGSVTIDDREFGSGGFANRHDVSLSSDGGGSANTFSIGQGFTLSAEVNLSVGFNSPRKEAGIRINSATTGDALFLLNSDAGEIVAFGGGAPFNSFGSNGGGNGYTPGDTILMGITYQPGVGAANGTLEYFIDRGAGLETTGPLEWANLEGGPVDFQVGFYSQTSPSGTGDFSTATFSNVTFIPAPSSLAVMALGAFAARRRR